MSDAENEIVSEINLRRRGGPAPALRARILAAAPQLPVWWYLAIAAGLLLFLSALIGPEPVPTATTLPLHADLHQLLRP